MPRPYRRFIPGRGDGISTEIRALQDVNLTAVDGQTVLKAGQTKLYDFDLQASLRTYEQRKTLNRLLGSQAILITRRPVEVDTTDNSASSEDSVISSSSSSEDISPRVEISSSSSEDTADDISPCGEIVDQPAAVMESAVEPTPVEPEAAPVTPVEADPLLGDPLLNDRLSEEDKLALLAELGLNKTQAKKMLQLKQPTIDLVMAVPKFPPKMELAVQVLEILAL